MLSLINFYRVKTGTVMQTFSIILSVLMMVVSVVVLPFVYKISQSFIKDDEGHSLRYGVL
jgi:prolipoprotein diacylglyceryltransferase